MAPALHHINKKLSKILVTLYTDEQIPLTILHVIVRSKLELKTC